MPLLLLLAFYPCYALAGSSEAWLAHWEKIPASALPQRVPDGDIKAFRLALQRQQENCREFRAKKFTHCGKEGHGVELDCDDATLKKLDSLASANKSWSTFYEKAKKAFDWYRFKAPENVLFTAYNSPLVEGSFQKTEKYKYPLYALPVDFVVPYYDRKAIDVDHILAGRGLELAYLESPADILRLQIEGSGVLETKDKKGKKKQIGINYAGKNGRPYVSVFKTLKDKGVDKKYLTFPGLKIYFHDHPEEMWPVLSSSPSYVFFSLTTEPPCGSARVHVTGGHSLAVDPSQIPLGLAAFIEAERPEEGISPDATNVPTKPFTRFAFAQDTGGAIKGAHADIYFGTGDYAMLASNSLHSRGNLYAPRAPKQSRPKN